MSVRERLFEIKELNISQNLMIISDAQLYEYTNLLNTFVENFPDQEQKLRAAVEANSIPSISKRLSDLRNMLMEISADKLAGDCWEQLSALKGANPKKIAAYINYLLSMLAALSIDIQMAIFIRDGEAETPAAEETYYDLNKVKIIMAVDDETFSLEMLKAALKGVSCRIIGAASSADALNILKTQKPDLFVLDIEMPEINGIELAKMIRGTGQIAPILFVTGNATKCYVEQAIATGAADFIIKPINPQSARERIGKFL